MDAQQRRVTSRKILDMAKDPQVASMMRELIAEHPLRVTQGNPEEKRRYRLDFSLAFGVAVIFAAPLAFPPVSRLGAIIYMILIAGGSLYPVLHFFDWLTNGIKRHLPRVGKALAVALPVVVEFFILCALAERFSIVFHPAVSAEAYVSLLGTSGNSHTPIALLFNNISEDPIESLSVTVTVLDKSSDTLFGAHQSTHIEGVEFYRPPGPDARIWFRGKDGQDYLASTGEMFDSPNADIPHSSWAIFCPRLPPQRSSDGLRVIIETNFSTSPRGASKKLVLTGSYVLVTKDGSVSGEIDKTVAVASGPLH